MGVDHRTYIGYGVLINEPDFWLIHDKDGDAMDGLQEFLYMLDIDEVQAVTAGSYYKSDGTSTALMFRSTVSSASDLEGWLDIKRPKISAYDWQQFNKAHMILVGYEADKAKLSWRVGGLWS